MYLPENTNLHHKRDSLQQIRFLSANICMISPLGNIKRQDIVGTLSVIILVSLTYLYRGFDFYNSVFAHICVIYCLFGFITVTMDIRKRFFFFQILPFFYFLLYAELNYFPEGQLIWNMLSCLSVIFISIPFMSVFVAGLIILIMPKEFHQQHKEERVQLLIEKLKNYDLVCIQESTIKLGNTYYEDKIIEGVKAYGLVYMARSSRLPTFPSLLCNSGLLVLSKYPIKESQLIPFKQQPWYQWSLYHKAAMYCKVQVSDRQSIHLVNLHTSISDKIIQDVLFFYSKNKHSDKNVVGLLQLQQMYDLLQEKITNSAQVENKSHQNVIVAGDFNQQPCSQEYKFITEKLSKINVQDLHLVDGTRQATIGQVNILGEPVERLMTSQNDLKISQTLDYIFSNMNTLNTGYDPLKNENEETHEIFQQVSDHWGVTATFSF